MQTGPGLVYQGSSCSPQVYAEIWKMGLWVHVVTELNPEVEVIDFNLGLVSFKQGS